MNQVFYLEPDEEVTKVINRIRKSEEDGVVFVIPRGASITQSVINLKLLKRSADELKKAIGIVSTDKITKNLANQVKIPVFDKVAEAEKAELAEVKPAAADPESSDLDLKVNTYKKYDLSKLNEGAENRGEKIENNPPAGGEIIEDREEDDQESESDDEEEVLENRDEKIENREEEPENIQEETDDRRGKLENREQKTENRNDEKKEEPVTAQQYHLQKRHIKTEGSRKVLVAFISVILISLLVLGYLFVPSAQASIVLKTTDLNKDFVLSAIKDQKEIDTSKPTVPGALITIEKDVTKSFDSTGMKDAGEKAKGTVTISNTVSTKAVPVSPGAKVTSADGKVFTVQTGVMVPGATLKNCDIVPGTATVKCDTVAGTIDANVVASATGEASNLAAETKFTVGTLTAENKAAFAGGLTKNVLFVTDSDLAKAETQIKSDALDQGKAELISKASDAGQKVVDKYISTEVISLDPDKKANDEADKFTMIAKIRIFALGFAEGDIQSAVIDLAASEIQTDEMLINADGNDITYEVTESDIDSGSLKIKASFKGKVGKKMDAEKIKQSIVNKGAGSAKNYLTSIDGVESATVSLSPSFLTVVPVLASRVKVSFDYQK